MKFPLIKMSVGASDIDTVYRIDYSNRYLLFRCNINSSHYYFIEIT